MFLLTQLFFAKLVKDVELLTQDIDLVVTDGSQLDLHDGFSIGHHHSHSSEKHLKIFGQFLSSGVTGIHSNEISYSVDNVDLDGFFGEPEFLDILFLGGSDTFDLTGDDGQDFQVDTVELVEASPNTGLHQSLEDLGHVFGSMLVSAVCDDDEDTESSSEILDGFSLTCSGRSCWGSSVEHGQSLGEGDVASISQGGDTESFLGSEELVRVLAVPISDGNDAVVHVLFPVDSGLFLPIKVGDVFAFDFHSQISLMHVDSNDGFDLLSFDGGREVFETHAGEEFHHLLDFSSLRLHSSFFVLGGSFESFSEFLSPHGLNSDQSDLRSVRLDEVSHLGNVDVGTLGTSSSDDVLEGFLHFVL